MGSETERPNTPVALGRRILVVDDEPLVCDSVKRMLSFFGHTVETATSGEQALDLFDKTRFDLVIIDYLMPGMRGDKLAATLRNRMARQPIVMISASGDVLRSERPMEGVDFIISKPFQLEELRNAIERFLPNSDQANPAHR